LSRNTLVVVAACSAGGLELGQVLVRDVVLALPIGELDHRHLLITGEPVN